MQEAAFEEIVQQAPIGFAVFSLPHFVVQSANPSYLELIAKKSEDFIGRPLFEVLPEVRNIVEPLFLNIVKTGEPFTFSELEVMLNRRGNTARAFFNGVYKPITDSGGQITGILVVAFEVTHQVVSRHLVAQSEQHFRHLFSESPIGMCIFRGKAMIIENANKALLTQLWKRELHEVLGKPLLEVFPELEGQPYPQLLATVMDTGVAHTDKESLAYIDSREGRDRYYLDFEYAPLFDIDNKTVTGIMVTVNNVTEKVLDRLKASMAEERLMQAISATGLGTFEVIVPDNHISYSEGFRQIFGLASLHENDWNKIRLIVMPEDRVIRDLAWKKAQQTSRLDYEFRTQLADDIRWVRLNGRITFNGDGEPQKVNGTVLDITQEKNASLALAESEQKFRLLADSMPSMVWTADADGLLNYFNLAVYEYTGLNTAALRDEGLWNAVNAEEVDDNRKAWKQSVQLGQFFLFEHRFRRHDNDYRWFLSRAVPQYDEHGHIRMWVGSSTDIHEHKLFSEELEKQVAQRTLELQHSNEELVKSNTDLAQFAYVASHDLQEPLRKIQTFAAMVADLDQSRLSKRGLEIFERLQATASRMQQLVQDLLSYSRVNKSDNLLQEMDMNQLVKNVLLQLDDRIREKEAMVQLDSLPVTRVIAFQVEQLFTNLLNNALKFAYPGRKPQIQITYEKEDRQHHIRFSDNGIGFDSQYNDKIFHVFQRLHSSQEFPGTGIGLAICRKIMDNHGGSIQAHGVAGSGASFDIYFPA